MEIPQSIQTSIGNIRRYEIRILISLRAGPSGRSPAEIVGSNPTRGMDVCLLWVLCVVR